VVEALHLATELRDVIVLAVEVVLQPVAQLNLAAAAAAAAEVQQQQQQQQRCGSRRQADGQLR
jgi:hypothetical protein